MPCRAHLLIAAILLPLGLGGRGSAEAAPPESAATTAAAEAGDAAFFEGRVAPILRVKCGKCHGPETRKAELDLTSAAGIRRGSESGEIVAAGSPDDSLLYQMVHEGAMPPDGEEPLTAGELETLRVWLAAGAALPAADAPVPRVTQHDVVPVLLLRCTVCHGARKQ